MTGDLVEKKFTGSFAGIVTSFARLWEGNEEWLLRTYSCSYRSVLKALIFNLSKGHAMKKLWKLMQMTATYIIRVSVIKYHKKIKTTLTSFRKSHCDTMHYVYGYVSSHSLLVAIKHKITRKSDFFEFLPWPHPLLTLVL